jgi:hypothetical protein
VFQLMKYVQLLRHATFPIRAEEEAWKSRVEKVEREVNKTSVFRGRLNEVWAMVGIAGERLGGSRAKGQAAMAGDSLSMDEDSYKSIIEVVFF